MNLPSRYKKLAVKFKDGGMSTAFLCEDSHLERQVVVKILQSNTDQKRLIDEVRALSSIRSKHIVEIYDVIRNGSGKIRAIVEEYVPGLSLSSKLGNCDANEILSIALAISSGISDIHTVGEIHRDIKPKNMKFDEEGCLKIFDFGLSRQEEVNSSTMGAVGTIGFMAPELWASNFDKVEFTRAVDVYAFGMTILSLIRGSLPAELRKVPPKLPCAEGDFSSQPIKLPVPVAQILNRCIDQQPSDRPLMKEVRDCLSRHLLFNKHRASLVVSGKVYYVDQKNKSVSITSGNRGSFSLHYDGLDFIMRNITGSIYINNVPRSASTTIEGSCVVTLGGPEMGIDRDYVPIDVSHPEVIS